MSLLHCPFMTYSCRSLRLHFPVAHSPRQVSLRSSLAMQGSCPFFSLPITQGIESWIPAHEKGNRVGMNGLKSLFRYNSTAGKVSLGRWDTQCNHFPRAMKIRAWGNNQGPIQNYYMVLEMNFSETGYACTVFNNI